VRQVNIRLLPGGSGKVRIHLFVHDEAGPASTPGGVVAVVPVFGPLLLEPSRGRIACQASLKDVTPRVKNGIIHPVVHSNEARAVTCPECMATDDYRQAMSLLAEIPGVAAQEG
jgi:hypothetical protein